MGPIEVKAAILIAAVAVGGFSIFWGYRLFKDGAAQRGTASAEAGSWKFAIKNYGPGVVFCAFGAGIIIFAITRDISQTTTTTRKTVPRPGITQPKSEEETFYTEETAVSTVAAASAHPEDAQSGSASEEN